jgi:MFS transporter, UMF1 family
MLLKRRDTLAWVLYDWGNSAFATTVIAGFFPVFFKQYWSAGTPATESTLQLGIANSVASLIVAVIAPILGAMADCGGWRKRMVLGFTVIGVLATAALAGVGRGDWPMAVLIFTIASLGFWGSNAFYDALVVDVSPEGHLDKVSALGYSAGYLGGGLLFALNVVMTLKPELFGLADSVQAVQLSFVSVAIWWALASVPLALWVHERGESQAASVIAVARAGWSQFLETCRHLRSYRPVMWFLFAYWLYIDGVYTVIKMAVDYGLSLGFSSDSLIVALLITQFVGFPSALVFGTLGERFGARRGIIVGISLYMAVTTWAASMDQIWEFYVMAVIIGLVQGGVQALSRSYYASIIPADKSGEFFGFYNMLGKFASIIGPLLMGFTAVYTGSSRLSILSLLVLFVLGLWFLMRVPAADERI